MRAPLLLLPVLTILGACDRSPTSPDVGRRFQPGKPVEALYTGPRWSLVSLPFEPHAINDAGVIVGTQNGQPVMWQNGTLTILPSLIGLTDYHVTAISPKGLIAGRAGNHVLLWTSPYTSPRDISGALPYLTEVIGVNDDQTVIYNSAGEVWRWTPATGARLLPSGNWGAHATGLNAKGYISGAEWTTSARAQEIPVRWDPAGHVTWLPFIESGAVATGIDSAGDIVGNAQTLCPDSVNEYCSSIVLLWHADGTLHELSALPTGDWVKSMSSTGWFISDVLPQHWAYFQGTLTYLSSPEYHPPYMEAVNGCGSIVGWSYDVPGTGWLWQCAGSLSLSPVATQPILSPIG